MRKNSLVMLGLAGMLLFIGCSKTESAFKYELRDVHLVAGRQGVCKENGDYRGKLKMDPSPKWLQGIACYNGSLYVTSDDGDADNDEADHMYRIDISDDKETGKVSLEKTFDDVIKQGEIEGLSFDEDRGQLLLLYNRGAKIVAGMPVGFYEGYSEEIHEVFVYNIGQ